ncbi:hypothetical protein RAB80_017339 [Fusarium oxysporum f. sp. vasinfectum]|nr:hypothetical protein RAB80_017339 [Fusarium oxysporum f. sp. vasinfectum]KAK2931885.1 hypothetical protein FoTM2_009403 [Fusarium oxysporum f. sp. vasinfectum]
MNSPARVTLDAFIEDWLSMIIDDTQSTATTSPIASLRTDTKLYHDMPTPPPSSTTPTCGDRPSPKRARHDDIQDNPFDNDRTPTPSLSSASSNGRSLSPVKKSTLQLLEKPVYFVPIDDDAIRQLPEDILATYDRITEVVDDRINLLPRAVEEELRSMYRQSKLRPHYFFSHDDNKTPIHIQELAALRKIEQAAKTCQVEEASEAAWNVEVQGPLLELALEPFPSLSRDILTQARISRPFVPEMKAASHYDFTRTKMIDWGIRLHPSQSTTARIQEILLPLPENQRSINQSTYGPVRFDPIAVSIETKTANGGAEEARLQLGVWVAAWHQRIRTLMRPNQAIVTLPLILVLEHKWQLLFACDRGSHIDIVESVDIGDTKGLMGMYTVLSVLRTLASWVQSEYATWFENFVNSRVPSP